MKPPVKAVISQHSDFDHRKVEMVWADSTETPTLHAAEGAIKMHFKLSFLSPFVFVRNSSLLRMSRARLDVLFASVERLQIHEFRVPMYSTTTTLPAELLLTFFQPSDN